MKSRKRKAVIASTMIFGLNVYVSSNDSVYVVKKGDTLSSILFAKKLKPIYGKHGTLVETLKLNPNISSSMGNKIFPKMKIFLINPKSADKTILPDNDETHSEDVADSSTTTAVQKKLVNDRIPSDDFKQSFYWEASPSLSWKNLSSTEENIYRSSQINALSNTSYGVSISYGMHFEENIDIYSKLFLESVSFVQDSSINLLKKQFIASSFSMGFSYEKKWRLEAAMCDEFFLTSPTISSVDIRKVTLPEIKSSYLKEFYQYRETKLSYSLAGNVFLPRSSPDVKSKLSYGAGGAIEAKLRNQSFSLGYDLKLLKASGNSTDYQNIYWKYIWETI